MRLLPSALTRLGRAAAALLLSLAILGPFSGPVFAQTSAAEAAIQDVIGRGNAAQTTALAARDPTLLGDSAVGAYAQQMVRTNQRLIDSGVLVIELVDVEWGPITVTGTTASATTFETWRTSFSEGPTDFTRDRNVYSLAQDAGGAWKITDNQHPDTRNRRPTIPPPDPPPPDGIPPAAPGTSRNWSGYAARGGAFTSVSATWTVPRLALDSPFGADAAWVGIGGLRTRDLIQAGTEQTATGAGSVSYQAWVEMLPDAARAVPLTVLPGETISVSVDQQAGDTWLFTFANLTSGQGLQRSVQYASTLSSAEWIEEAPFARRRILPISQFGSVTFSKASAVKDGQSLTIADLGARPISLVDNTGRLLAVPSPLAADGAGFTVSRT